MAVDTALKRFSMIQLGGPNQLLLPIPDNIFSPRDRAMLLLLYSGITLSGGAVERTASRLLLLGVGR